MRLATPFPRHRWSLYILGLAAWLGACGGAGGGGATGSGGGGGPPPPALSCVALDFSGPPVGPQPYAPCSGCTCTSIGYTPLTDLGTGTYQGFEGGLYCEGSNARPSAHEAAGVALAQAVGPLDAGGSPSPAGRYVFVSIGMSNTTQEFSTFVPMANAEPGKDPRLVVVDCAQGGQAADAWADPANAVWPTLDARLAAAGVTPAQVVTAWVKLAEKSPSAAFPQDALALANDMAATLRNLKAHCPNVAMAYLSSRIYAGYATSTLNPEPYAYQTGFAVKKLILDQISGDTTLNYDAGKGAVLAPWIAWGPYLWADGTTPRGDGLAWACSDLVSDGTHPSATGRAKVAQMLLDFVKTDTTASPWFLGP